MIRAQRVFRPRSHDSVDRTVVIAGIGELALKISHVRIIAVAVRVTVVVTVTVVVSVAVVTVPVITAAAVVSVRVTVGIIAAVPPRKTPPTPERETKTANEEVVV